MHGVRERLQAARRHAADGADQRQDASVHQLAGWGEREGGGGEQKEKRGAVILSTHGGMVKTNRARPWTAPAPHLCRYLWAKNAPRTAILVPQISQTERGGKKKKRKAGAFVVSCFYLLFILRICCAQTTNNTERNEIQTLECGFIQYSMRRRSNSRQLHHLPESCKAGISLRLPSSFCFLIFPSE